MSKYTKESELRIKKPEPELISYEIPNETETVTDELSLLNHQLIYYYNTEKPYFNPTLKIEDVSAKLNIPQRTIAALLKKHHNSNFNAFTNRFRAEEAKQLMESEKYKNYTIEAIARDAGFGSRQSFYNSFELHTGVKPSYYRNYIARNSTSSEIIL